ncbi:MAG: hypothetical protein IME96_00420 [Proteobacteria bacterium]|nr:hypothetical protein [Pseudomonadota bacterium]
MAQVRIINSHRKNAGEIIAPDNIELNSKVYVWMSFFGPKGDTGDMVIEFKKNDVTWKAAPMTVTGTTRYRTWAHYKFGKAGDWTISIKRIDEENGRSVVLKEIMVKVQ